MWAVCDLLVIRSLIGSTLINEFTLQVVVVVLPRKPLSLEDGHGPGGCCPMFSGNSKREFENKLNN